MTMTSLRLTAALATIVLLAGCGSGAQEGGADGDAAQPTSQPTSQTAEPAGGADGVTRVVRIESLVLSAEEFDDVIELTGTVEADHDATISARTAGTIVRMSPLGTRVSAGYTVAQIDPSLAQAALDQANAQLEVARAQLDLSEDMFARQEPLYRDSIISAIEFEQAKAQLSQSRAQHAQAAALVKQAEEGLRLTHLSAPFTGSVEAHFVEEGEQVSPGVAVVRVVSTSRVRVKAGVPERFAGDIRIGTRVNLRFDAYGIEEKDARVTFVGSAIDAASRTLPIEVEVGNPDGRLKPEMIADVFVTRSTSQDAIVVPQSAVLRDEEGTSVYVVDRSGARAVAQRRVVRLGGTYAGRVEVLEGLSDGDELITVGAASVAPGDVVETLRTTSMTEAM